MVAHGPFKETGNAQDKATTFNVYTRKFSRKIGEGKKNTQEEALVVQKHQEAFLSVSEGRDGEMGIKESSSSDDDNSSEEFIITSDFDVEVEKEKQEAYAYEGIRCLLGDGSQEVEGVKGTDVVKV